MKEKTVRNAECRYGLITDGGQLLSEAKLPLTPEAFFMRVGRAMKAPHHCPRLNYPGDVREQPQLHGLAGEHGFILSIPAFVNCATRIIENNPLRAFLFDLEKGRGKLPAHKAQHR